MYLKKEKNLSKRFFMICQESLPKSGCQVIIIPVGQVNLISKAISNFSYLYFGPMKAPFQIGKIGAFLFIALYYTNT